jgi:hypothetical protein
MISPIVQANAISVFCEEKIMVDEGEMIKVISLYSPLINKKFDLQNK